MKTVNAPFLVLLSVLLASASATPDEDAATHDKDVLMCVKVAKAKANPKADSHAVFNQCMKCAQCERDDLPPVPNMSSNCVDLCMLLDTFDLSYRRKFCNLRCDCYQAHCPQHGF